MSPKTKVIWVALLGLAVLLGVERLVSWYFQPLVHPRFIQMLFKEDALVLPHKSDIAWISHQLKARLYIHLVVNSDYDITATKTAHLYIFDPNAVRRQLVPRKYLTLLDAVKDNCRAITERKVVYCDVNLLKDIERAGQFREAFAGVLFHELGHIFDGKAIFDEVDRRKEEQVEELIGFIDEAEQLTQLNAIHEAAAIVARVRRSPSAEDARVRDRLAGHYLAMGQYEQASGEYRALIAEGRALFQETDEKYQSVLRYQTLLAHCLTALEQYEEARSLYLEVASGRDVDAYIRTVAQAGLGRSDRRDQFTRASGLVVVAVKPGQEAERLGIVVGDIITAVNGLVVGLPENLGTSLRNPGVAEIQIYKSATDIFEELSTEESRLGVTVSTF